MKGRKLGLVVIVLLIFNLRGLDIFAQSEVTKTATPMLAPTMIQSPNQGAPSPQNHPNPPTGGGGNEQERKCLLEISRICGNPGKIGIRTFLDCMDKRSEGLTKECKEFHEKKQAERLKRPR